MLRSEIFRSASELIRLEPAWNTLQSLDSESNIFLSWEMLNAWRGHYSPDGRCAVYCVFDGQELAAGLPLIETSAGAFTFMNAPDCADYSGFLLRPSDKQALAALAAVIASDPACRSMRMWGIRAADSRLLDFSTALRKQGLHVVAGEEYAAPYFRLPSDFNDWEAGLKKNLRRDLRAGKKALAKAGDLTLRRSKAGAEFRQDFDYLRRFHLDRQSSKRGSSVLARDSDADFYGRVLPDSGAAVEISTLTLNGKPVAAAYGLFSGRTYHYWIPSFDESMARMSVGKLHIDFLIRDLSREGVEWFDFMGGDEAYKLQWTPIARPLGSLFASRSSLAAAKEAGRRSIRSIARKMKNRLLGTSGKTGTAAA